MTDARSPFSDDHRGPGDPPVDASGPSPDDLLALAAWLDGRGSDADAASMDDRLAEDPALRELAASARLAPVTPDDLADERPNLAAIARATALVPGSAAPSAHAPDAVPGASPVAGRIAASRSGPADADADRGRWLRWTIGIAASVAVAYLGLRAGSLTGEPTASPKLIADSTPDRGATDREAPDARSDSVQMVSETSVADAASFGVFSASEAEATLVGFLLEESP